MKKQRFSEEQIIGVLQEVRAREIARWRRETNWMDRPEHEELKNCAN